MSVLKTSVLVALASGLSGCVQSQAHLSSDFGYALRTAAVAQIANPDAVYAGPPPPSDGARAAGAQERYRAGKVTEPTGIASTITSAASVGGEKD